MLCLTPKFAVRRLQGWDLNLHLTVIPKADFQLFHALSPTKPGLTRGLSKEQQEKQEGRQLGKDGETGRRQYGGAPLSGPTHGCQVTVTTQHLCSEV